MAELVNDLVTMVKVAGLLVLCDYRGTRKALISIEWVLKHSFQPRPFCHWQLAERLSSGIQTDISLPVTKRISIAYMQWQHWNSWSFF